MNILARWPAFVDWMRRRSADDPESGARRSIRDPVVRFRTMNDPDVRLLYDALTASTFDRMALRLPGTRNDIFVTRTATTYPLAQIAVPVLAVHGTADRIVPFSHANAIAAQVPGAELLAIEGGEHVCIFTHRQEVMTRVNRFLAAHSPVRMNHPSGP